MSLRLFGKHSKIQHKFLGKSGSFVLDFIRDAADVDMARQVAIKVRLAKSGSQVPITDAAIALRKEYFQVHFPLPVKDVTNTPKSTVPAWAEGL